METKSGYRTTEFWAMLGVNLLGLLVLFGVFTGSEAESYMKILERLTGLVTMAVNSGMYSLSRGAAKSKKPMMLEVDS